MLTNSLLMQDISKNRVSVSDSIVDLIVNHLIEKQLKPGEKLPTESEFAKKLNVGRNSVREAIKMLSFLGVVEIRRGIGTFVSEECSASMFNPLILGLIFEQGTSEELRELRFLFEYGMMQIIMKKVTDEDIANLERANERIKDVTHEDTGNRDFILECDRDFHRIFMGIANNRLVSKIGEIVYVLYRESVSVKQKSLRDPISIYQGHKLIIEELRKKNLEGILNLIEKFIKNDIERMEGEATIKR